MERVRVDGDLEIACELDGSAGNDRPLVVLLHDYALSGELVFGRTGIRDALADADLNTLLLDLRGHGGSAAADAGDGCWGEAVMARDVDRLLDEVAPGRRVDLVGYGMGAVVAVLLAARIGDRVRRAVLAGVGAALVEQGGIDRTELPPELLVPALTAADDESVTEPFGRAWRAFARTVGADLPSIAAQAAAFQAGVLPLAELTAPTLILAGADDNLARRPEILADALPDAHLELVGGVDHLRAPGDPAVAHAIVGFLRG